MPPSPARPSWYPPHRSGECVWLFCGRWAAGLSAPAPVDATAHACESTGPWSACSPPAAAAVVAPPVWRAHPPSLSQGREGRGLRDASHRTHHDDASPGELREYVHGRCRRRRACPLLAGGAWLPRHGRLGRLRRVRQRVWRCTSRRARAACRRVPDQHAAASPRAPSPASQGLGVLPDRLAGHPDETQQALSRSRHTCAAHCHRVWLRARASVRAAPTAPIHTSQAPWRGARRGGQGITRESGSRARTVCCTLAHPHSTPVAEHPTCPMALSR